MKPRERRESDEDTMPISTDIYLHQAQGVDTGGRARRQGEVVTRP